MGLSYFNRSNIEVEFWKSLNLMEQTKVTSLQRYC